MPTFKHGSTIFHCNVGISGLVTFVVDRPTLAGPFDPVSVPLADLRDFVEAMAWVGVEERLPTTDSRYLVYCPSADPEKPLVAIAWYDPSGYGWSLLPPNWIDAITHWREVPKPPEA